MALIHQLGLDPADYPPTVHTGLESTRPAGPARAGARAGAESDLHPADPHPAESDPAESDPGPMFRLGTDS